MQQQRGPSPMRLPAIKKEPVEKYSSHMRSNRFRITSNHQTIRPPSLNSSIIQETQASTPKSGVIPPKTSVRNSSLDAKTRAIYTPQIPVKRSIDYERPRANSVFRSRQLPPQQRYEKVKFSGMWEKYEEIWFDIHSSEVNPLFCDMPTPKAKVYSRSVDPKPRVQTQPVLPDQPEKKAFVFPKSYVIKVLRDDPFGRPCEKCHQKVRKGFTLGCKHFYCKPCLHSNLKTHLEQKIIPIRCCNITCQYHLEKSEIMKLVANTEEVQQFYELFMTKYVDKNPHLVARCFTNGCGYVVNLQRLKNKNVFHCSRCQKTYCIKCHEYMHWNRDCRETTTTTTTN